MKRQAILAAVLLLYLPLLTLAQGIPCLFRLPVASEIPVDRRKFLA